MIGIINYMQFCRLCLVKEKVNVPIFDNTNDDKQLFLKITQCLPVKVSPDDKLPKSICESCLHKVDSIYQFQNMTVNSEKQLVQWLKEVGIDISDKSLNQTRLECTNNQHEQHSIHTDIVLKQEQDLETLNVNAQTYQNQSYQDYNLSFSQMAGDTGSAFSQSEVSQPTSVADESDRGTQPDNSEDDAMTGNRIAKEEVESEEDYDEAGDALEPTAFVGVPSTSVSDEERPGPSGLSKPGPNPGRDVHSTILTCEVCYKMCKDQRSFKRHQLLHVEKNLLCANCGKMFKTHKGLYQHEKTVHIEAHNNTCAICNLKFPSRSEFFFHYKRYHLTEPTKCRLCNKSFLTKTAYKLHCQIIHEGLRYICFPCNRMFNYESSYTIHMKRHDPNHVDRQYVCKICCKVYNRRNSLGSHLQTHSRLVCDICGKKLANTYSLSIHRKRHLGDRQFICDYCGKAFIAAQELNTHRITHTSGGFMCNLCGEKFQFRTYLNVHMKAHDGTKPCWCDICEKSFTRKCHYLKHQKLHDIRGNVKIIRNLRKNRKNK